MPTDITRPNLNEYLHARLRAQIKHEETLKFAAQRDFWIGMGAVIGLVLAAAAPLAWLVVQWFNGRF